MICRQLGIVTTTLLCVCTLLAQDIKPPAVDTVRQEKHTITPEDVLGIRELSQIKLSPDGKQILFVVTEPNDPNKPREPRTSNIWVVPSDGRHPAQPLISGLKGANSPR